MTKKPCRVDQCDKIAHAKGLCHGHYARLRKGMDVDGALRVNYDEQSRCVVDGCGNRPRGKGLCGLHYQRDFNEDSNYSRNYSFKRKYGISLDQFRAKLEAQNYCCAVCARPIQEGNCHIDHDHECCPGGPNAVTCGKCVRGILCKPCNMALGLFGDSIEALQNAIAYISEWRNPR